MITNIFSQDKKYGIIFSDPPMKNNSESAQRSVFELYEHVTKEMIEEKHNIFIWTTDKNLVEIENMMKSLGYRVHVRIIWDKETGPAPSYTLKFSHEYLLWFFKRNRILLPVKEKQGAFPTVMRENSRKHSQKPECAYEMIEAMFPGTEKLELFARAERDGWNSWGNEL